MNQRKDRPYILQVLELNAVNEDHKRNTGFVVLNQRLPVASSVRFEGIKLIVSF
jgi:hypothetical protein